MPPTAVVPTEPPARPGAVRRFALRGVRVAGIGLVIGGCLWSIGHGSLKGAIVYSLCISLSCWLLIDGARQLSVRVLGAEANRGWPGRGWMAVTVVAGAAGGYAIGNAIGNRITGLDEPGPFDVSRGMLSMLALSLVPAVAITTFFQLRETIADQSAAVERAERRAAEERLKLLESQLEPHMLFNTLANLRALIAADPPRAQAMLDRLIAFLRASLAGSRVQTHTLAAELERVRDYLELMRIRMGARLEAHVALPEALRDAEVPPMILQPVVENAIRHGLEPKREGGRIEVAASRQGDALVLTVVDSGVGLSTREAPGNGEAASSGFGLAHVRERLATLYPPGDRATAATFSLAPVDPAAASRGTRAELRLPLRTFAP